METTVGELEITKLLNNYVDLFEFMGLDKVKYSDPEFIFTYEYKKGLRKAAVANNRKYHTDKYPNSSDKRKDELERLFNQNQIIFYILNNKEVYDQYIKLKSEIVSNHNELRDNFIRLNDDDIKRIIKDANEGKSFEDLSKEKDIYHGIDRSLEQKLSIEESSIRLNDLINQRTNIYENIKNNIPKIEFDEDSTKFADMFNREFEKNIKKNEESYEIQPYNDFGELSKTFNFQNFDYGSMFDNRYSGINDSFALLSSNIPDQITDNLSLEDKIKKYNDLTKHYENIAKQINIINEEKNTNESVIINVKTNQDVD
jgi:hypothetical protein